MSKGKKNGSGEFPHSLRIVQKFFPKVTSVEDGKEETIIEVTKQDSNSAKVKNHESCAYAVACKRALKADGVIVAIKTLYVIRGTDAFRYHIPESVSREIVSFDRNAGFAPGTYKIKPVSDANKLGAYRGYGPKKTTGKKAKFIHQTSGIRTVLGSQET